MSRKITIPNFDHFLERYLKGESENSLSNEIGVSRSVFRRHLNEHGVDPRGRSEAELVKWERMTASERKAQYAAAHKAAKGREVSFTEKCKRAQSHEGDITYNVSEDEIVFGKWLSEMGYPFVHNLAVGPYNCDIGCGSVTVEIWGGGWHPKDGEVERTKYILDRGYSMLIIDLDQRRHPLTRKTLDYFVTLLQLSTGNPPSIRQYWMIRGDGEVIFKRTNSDDISLVPPFTSGRDIANGTYKRAPR